MKTVRNNKNPIIISTGIYRFAYESEPNYVNKILEFYANHQELTEFVDGVELNIRGPEVIETLNISRKSQLFIQKLEHNTLHYFYLIPFGFSPNHMLSSEHAENIKRLKSLNELFRFKAIVLHPFPYIKGEVEKLYEIFHDELNIPSFNFESMLRDKDISQYDFEKLFIHKNIGLVLDASHATAAGTSGSLYTFQYLEPLYERVSYIHISSTRRDLAYVDDTGFYCPSKGHSLFVETNPEDLSLFDPVFDLINRKNFLGIVLEQGIKEKNITPLVNEINFIKGYFFKSPKV